MSKLRAPLHEHLAPQVDEAAIRRVWLGIRRRRGASWFARRPGLPAWSWGLAAGVLAVAVGVLVLRPRPAPSAADAVQNGPLVSRAGSPLSVLGGEPASSNELSDGSAIALGAGSRLEVLENTAKTFVTVLRSGRAAFAVRPGGPRRWTVEAGIASVEVVGTRFSVTRSAGGVEISVEHGVVLVRSELIQDRVQLLTAGQQLSVRPPAPEPAAAQTNPVRAAPPAPSLAALNAGADLAGSASSMAQLLGRADERRRHGDVQGAEAALRLALSSHAHEPAAALAAFTLGKLLLDAAGRPAEAAQVFARCLALSPPSALAEDALYRLAEAQARAGDLAAASRTAGQYRGRYPNGRHASELSRWLDPH